MFGPARSLHSALLDFEREVLRRRLRPNADALNGDNRSRRSNNRSSAPEECQQILETFLKDR